MLTYQVTWVLSVGQLAWSIICIAKKKFKVCPRPPSRETYANSSTTIEISSNLTVKQLEGWRMVLCVSAVDFSLDKWMPLILKKIFPSHCQKNIITGYCLRRPPFHLCYTHKAWGDTATVRFPKSSLSNLPAPPDLR